MQLSLPSNGLAGTIPSSFCPSQMTYLDVSGNSLGVTLTFGCPTITFLNVSGCGCSDASDSFYNALTGAVTVDMSKNRLSNLRNSIGSLSACTHLDLSYNALSQLPNTFPQMTSLTELYLDGNHLDILIPLCGLAEIRVLTMNYNAVILGPGSNCMSNMKTLKVRLFHDYSTNLLRICRNAVQPCTYPTHQSTTRQYEINISQSLYLNNNNLNSDLSLLSSLNLSTLSVDNNIITGNLRPLNQMSSLQYLSVRNNSVRRSLYGRTD